MARKSMKIPAYKPKGKGGASGRSRAQNAAIAIALRGKKADAIKKSKAKVRPVLSGTRKKFSLNSIKPSKPATSVKLKKSDLKVLKSGSGVEKWAHKHLKRLTDLKKIKKGTWIYSENKNPNAIPRKKRRRVFNEKER